MIFFAGQGSQYVGMGKDLLKYPEAKDMFELASETLQYVSFKSRIILYFVLSLINLLSKV